MAGYENIKDKGFDHRSTAELRDISAVGGKASGESRRKKANFRKTLNALLTAKIDSSEWSPLLDSLGLDSTLESAVNAAMIRKALSGDVKAYEVIARYSGQSDGTDTDHEEQKARVEREKAQADVLKDKRVKEQDAESSVIQNMQTLAEILQHSQPNRNIEDYEGDAQ